MGRIDTIEKLAIRNNLLPLLRAAEVERRLVVSQIASRGTQIISQQTANQAQKTEIQAKATYILQLQEQLGVLEQSSGRSMLVNNNSPIGGTKSVNASVDSSTYVIDAPTEEEFE